MLSLDLIAVFPYLRILLAGSDLHQASPRWFVIFASHHCEAPEYIVDA